MFLEKYAIPITIAIILVFLNQKNLASKVERNNKHSFSTLYLFNAEIHILKIRSMGSCKLRGIAGPSYPFKMILLRFEWAIEDISSNQNILKNDD